MIIKLKVREAIRLLLRNGFVMISNGGSHAKFKRVVGGGDNYTITVTSYHHQNKLLRITDDRQRALFRELLAKEEK